MCNNDDNDKSSGKTLRDRMYRKPWRTVLYTFLGTLAILLISWITGIRGGLFAIISYPVSLPFYGLSWVIEKKQLSFRHSEYGHPFVIFLWSLPVVFFVLDLLGVPL